MRIGTQLGLSEHDRGVLLYTILLKDLGGSSNSAAVANLFGADDLSVKRAFRLVDWTKRSESVKFAARYSSPGFSKTRRTWNALKMGVQQREVVQQLFSSRVAQAGEVATQLHLPLSAVAAIRTLDEHWDGSGMAEGLVGSSIPMLARIAGLAQTVEVFARSFDVESAYEMARRRRGTWFDPVMVDSLNSFRLDASFWSQVQEPDQLTSIGELEPAESVIFADDRMLDSVAESFAKVVDAKSPFTRRHSHNVAFLAARVGRELAVSSNELRTLRRAALLHDIGMLGISSRLIEKPSSLDRVEVEIMRSHTGLTLDILKRVPVFRRFASTAASHHERLDGSGYHLGIKGAGLGLSARIIAAADVCEALSSDRPHRSGMPLDTVLARLEELVAAGHLCATATDALIGWFEGGSGEMKYDHTPETISQAA